MRIVKTIAEMQAARNRLGEHGGLVPTMGALHAGHVSLVQAAKAAGGWVAASIFVNPTQFAPGEDLAHYPRTFEADCAVLEAEGVDLLFAPAADEMYTGGATYIDVGPLGDRLDGVSRPGHFRGVATVVAKLFNIVRPQRAYFGQKDAAQVAVLRAMVRDLNFAVQLIVCPTVREPNGLAMSSRNRYLSMAERTQAARISKALFAVQVAPSRELLAAGLAGMDVEYAEFVDRDTLLPVEDLHGALVAVAVRIGTTRLIDNVLLEAR